jgi:tetratricopeptide (TPR) repeat protein
MRSRHRTHWLLASLCSLLLQATGATAQDVPLMVLDYWMYHDERGWKAIARQDYTQAEIEFDKAIEQLVPYKPRNPRLLARSYCDLANVLYHQGRYSEAEPLAKWALSVREADKKSSPEAVFQCVYTLGSIHAAQQHFAAAEPLLAHALALQESVLGPGDVNTLDTLDRLATVQQALGKYREAARLYLRELAIHERNTPDENLDLAETALHYAALLRRLNRAEEAASWEARALKIQDTVAIIQAKIRAGQAEKAKQSFK